MDIIPILIIFIPILFSILIYLFHNKFVNYTVFLSQAIITFLSINYFILFDNRVTHTIVFGGWNKEIGIALRNDHLSMLFIFLTIFIWWVTLIYCWNKRKHDYKFLFFLLFLEGSFLGLVQTNDLFNLFVFIEIITILSTILILYKKDGYSIRAGLYYLLFNSVGMIFFLIGLIFLYNSNGTLNVNIVTQRIVSLRDTHSIMLSYIFFMVSIGVKSAFFPVYNWLPKAHSAAPSSISALLSGLLVKSGLYAFIRINAMYGIEGFNEFFFFLGFFTALSGAIFAMCQKDIKQLLAFSTISQIGLILMGLSGSRDLTLTGGVFHILNHALLKSLLFMGAGVIINFYGKRRITEIKGVIKSLPFTSILMIIAMLSISGVPLLNGYIGKSIIKYSLQQSTYQIFMLNTLNITTLVLLIKLSQIFIGDSVKKKPKYFGENTAMIILGIACIIISVFYVPIGKIFFNNDLAFISIWKYSVWINYFANILISYIIYWIFIAKDSAIQKKIRHINFSFATTNVLLILFIFIMIMWRYFMI